jgi:hypothetical protein
MTEFMYCISLLTFNDYVLLYIVGSLVVALDSQLYVATRFVYRHHKVVGCFTYFIALAIWPYTATLIIRRERSSGR